MYTNTHTRLTALCPGLPKWAGTRKVEPVLILLKQETVSGSGISWAICKSAPRSRQITMPAPHRSVFTGRMPFLLPNQKMYTKWVQNGYVHQERILVQTSLFLWLAHVQCCLTKPVTQDTRQQALVIASQKSLSHTKAHSKIATHT